MFRAKRHATVETAEFFQAKGCLATHFHAGLTAPEKKDIQDRFLAGEIRVVCATNAFGMGIDKEDVRLVIHADTPGRSRITSRKPAAPVVTGSSPSACCSTTRRTACVAWELA